VEVTRIEFADGCVTSAKAAQLHLDSPLEETDMRALATDASLQYRPDFPRPYFRIHRSREYVLQGVLGSTTLRVTLLPLSNDQTLSHITELLTSGGLGDGEPR